VDVRALTEGELSVSHEEEHLAHGENINWRSSVSLVFFVKFRCHVVDSSALCHECLAHGSSKSFHQAEVSQFNDAVFRQEEVLELEVTMRDTL